MTSIPLWYTKTFEKWLLSHDEKSDAQRETLYYLLGGVKKRTLSLNLCMIMSRRGLSHSLNLWMIPERERDTHTHTERERGGGERERESSRQKNVSGVIFVIFKG
jgi:hypothetical protein